MLVYSDKTHVKDLLKNLVNIPAAETTEETVNSAASVIERIGNVAIVSVVGDITIHSGLSLDAQRKYGVCDLDTLNLAIESLQRAEDVTAVVFWFHTQGGGADGLYSTWNAIDQLSRTKLCVAFCDSVMASAGYLLASACHVVTSTPDSTLGAVGCVFTTCNADDCLIIASGEYKAALNGSVETAGQKEYLQKMVNQEGERFWQVANVKRTLNDAVKLGGVYRFADHTAMGLVNLHVANVKEVIVALLN